MWPLVVIGFVMSASFAQPAEGQGLPTSTGDRVVLRSEGNELTAWRTVPVPFRSLAALSAALERPLPGPSRAVRLVRTAPPGVVEYTLCVTPEGTLVLGEQLFELDKPGGRRVLVRGELGRGHMPLEQSGPWTWLVGVPLSREAQVTLHVRAGNAGWPVRSVTIDIVGAP